VRSQNGVGWLLDCGQVGFLLFNDLTCQYWQQFNQKEYDFECEHIMNESDRKFWPFKPRTSIVLSIVMLVGLLFVLTVLKNYGLWHISAKSDTAVFISVVLASLLPVVLAVLDIIIERGGVIEYGSVKIDFSKVSQTGMSEIAMPVNIGLPNQPVDSSSMPDILGALSEAASCDVVIIDLGNGKAWWETRLLVLLAGAVRLKKPEKVVFVGKDGGVDKCFQGWSHPHELLPLLLETNSQYELSYNKALAEIDRAELVEYTNFKDPVNPGIEQPLPEWIKRGLNYNYYVPAFNEKGLLTPLFAEQLLAYDLDSKVEYNEEEGPKTINITNLKELFGSVLYKKNVDETWASKQQMTTFFEINTDYFAITIDGRYKSIVSKMSVLNSMIKQLVMK